MRSRAWLLLAALAAVPVRAAIDGVVVNAATGRPTSGIEVSLVEAGAGGMKTVATQRSDANGKFNFNEEPKGPALLQGVYLGVTYSTVIQPGAPHTGLQLTIHGVTSRPGVAKLAQHMILLEPLADKLRVTETYLVRNETNETFADPSGGSLQFFVPEEGKAPEVTVQSGMVPVQREATETGRKRVFKIDYPMRPGETRVDVAYTMPPSGEFKSRMLSPDGVTRLVTPAGVTLKGAKIESLGQEPQTQANIYGVQGDTIAAAIEGTGTLRGEGGQEAGGSGPEIRQIRPRLYDRLYVILALSFGFLAAGFGLLFRRASGKS